MWFTLFCFHPFVEVNWGRARRPADYANIERELLSEGWFGLGAH
jgi:hypothetical protein